MTKTFYTSKTFWLNAVALGVYVAQQYGGVTSLPAVDPGVIAIANLVLRWVTKQPITL